MLTLTTLTLAVGTNACIVVAEISGFAVHRREGPAHAPQVDAMQWERLSEEDQRQIQDMALEAAKVSAGGECLCQNNTSVLTSLAPRSTRSWCIRSS